MSERQVALRGSGPVITIVSPSTGVPRKRERVRVTPSTARALAPRGSTAAAESPWTVTAGPGRESHQRAAFGGGDVMTPDAAAMASTGARSRSTRGSGARTASPMEVSATE